MPIKKHKNDDQKQSKKKMRQFHLMLNKLHQMLQSLGQQAVGQGVIKLDQFEKLRRAFAKSAQIYERENQNIKNMPDKVLRAQTMFKIMENKKIMEESLQQMTTLCIKLKQKISKQKVKNKNTDKYKTPNKKKRQFQQVNDMMIADNIENSDQKPEQGQNLVNQKSPLQKQLQYKNLTLYNMQRIYFKLIQTERKQVASTKRDIKQNKYGNLQQLLEDAENRRMMNQISQQNSDQQQEDSLEQKQILQAIKQLDDQIQQKLDAVLQGIDIMHYNALNISQGVNDVHKKIIINLNMVEKNQSKLNDAQKMLDQVTPHARKPSCICNVVLFFLLALVAFLMIKLFAFPDQPDSDVPKLFS